MNRTFFLFAILIFLSTGKLFSQATNIGDKWDVLDSLIVNNAIDDDDALEMMQEYESDLDKYFKKNSGKNVQRNDWAFPLKNFTSINYRDHGNDYKISGYDYFQGGDTKGHPAHDLMILDLNKDIFDDSTKMPVDVVSMSSGVVIATDVTWEPGSKLRGGKYVKIYDATNKGIFYYSHLSKVFVKPGDIINAGTKIGEVGRTGRKANLPGGKTHLHVAFLKLVDGYPKPDDIIKELRKAEQNYLNSKR